MGEVASIDAAAGKAAQPGMTEEQWLEERRKGVGASEVSCILGENPYASTYELWATKCGLLDDDWQDNERMHWGRILEPAIAEEYSRRSGFGIVDHGRFATQKHPELPVLFATVDREILNIDRGPGSLECKNTRELFKETWESGGPMMYRIQLQTQLEVMGWDWGALAVLIGGGEFLSIEMERDKELGAMILEEVEAFWKLVESRTEPEMDGSKATHRILKRLHPKDYGTTIQLDDALRETVDRWTVIKKNVRDLYRERLGLGGAELPLDDLPRLRVYNFQIFVTHRLFLSVFRRLAPIGHVKHAE